MVPFVSMIGTFVRSTFAGIWSPQTASILPPRMRTFPSLMTSVSAFIVTTRPWSTIASTLPPSLIPKHPTMFCADVNDSPGAKPGVGGLVLPKLPSASVMYVLP